MPSAEGRGRARAAWDAYVRATNVVLGPALKSAPVERALRSVSAGTVSDVVGFWLLWHLHGGFEGLRELGMSRASIFRKVATFRKLFGVHPDEYQLPGVSLDLDAYFGNGKDTNEN